ncbi:hypothetical protein SAY87_015700 [Trapa incisa]|uniref:C2 domain-containing protein n=1 Tax=Trapa incisa TaxID=236973 RepID=A0AAN7L8L8_9MYRT|nr:hypothetical protein SAY87_015700 [Trapa incisa]
MEATSLEFTQLSCTGLKSFNFFLKLSPYLAVSVVPGPDHKSRRGGDADPVQFQKTPVDYVGNRNPVWENYTVSFDLRPYSISSQSSANSRVSGDRYVKFEVQIACPVFRSRPIGEIWIPLRELVEEFSGAPRLMNYKVKSADEVVGILHFSSTVKGKQPEGMARAASAVASRRWRTGATNNTPYDTTSNPSPWPVLPEPQPGRMPARYEDVF